MFTVVTVFGERFFYLSASRGVEGCRFDFAAMCRREQISGVVASCLHCCS